ncbi:glycosyltransferase family 4 protein [Rhizobacter sp. AJA081-3]|uniref:MraY family glycosyltransferase n=1 Tax=Rhizobacter sp. AJA081-3 TaxID=2753607 RepID=UPI001ADF5070|nr:glycosyltransferase family 4 protein [Rhizobacter sp. AJA081-3]QTN24247.1 glycosyltransferase family 4 protein [Rhizobacter sp. AJA081-3]
MSSGFFLAVLSAAAIAISWALTLAVRRYAMAVDLLDHPNERSSHSAPTPRGGGVGFVACFIALSAMLWHRELVGTDMFAALCGGGGLVAVLGFVDDRKPLPARVRFVGHVFASAWVLWWLGPLPAVPIIGMIIPLGTVGLIASVGYLVWSINLFNFMDGIDGIAGVELISVALGGALVWHLGGESTEWSAAVLLAACVAGFLVLNFPPARVFMGDAGSGFLGLLIAALSLWCGRDHPVLFWSWLILYGCFMVDATTTLVRRVRRGERFYVAHRSHAYQYASRLHKSHRTVTLAIGAINLAWLLPVALMVALRRLDGVVGTLIAYAPLVWLAYRYKAGDRTAQAA